MRETSSLWTFTMDKLQAKPYEMSILGTQDVDINSSDEVKSKKPNPNELKIEYIVKEKKEFESKEDIIKAIQSRKGEENKDEP
jgi:hypothetical protein